VGPYELIRRIAQGGMAQVWLARRPGFGGADKPCALKLPLPHLAGDERFRRMFLAEARVAMRLSHGNVVGTFDVGEDGDLLYMAMQWVDGVDLAALAETLRETGTAISPSVAAHIVGELLAALDYAHTFAIGGRPEGIVHRDVSPHNVLVSTAGEVLLTDFGIARIVHEQTSQEHAKGKLRYMAAEHLRGHATTRSDLYAVGAILHELLEGRKFREGLSGEAFSGSGHGGYSAWTAARYLDGPAEVSLRKPPPLEEPMEVVREDGTVRLGDVLEAEPVELGGVDAPAFVDVEAARDARDPSLWAAERHPFPTCFACGPRHPDGLYLYPGPLDERRFATDWTPPADCDAATVWAALDCPSCAPVMPAATGKPIVLARLAVDVRPLPASEPHVIVSEAVARDGRKLTALAALYGGDGELRALARALWIELR
jgi:serine/threonine protein kinase